MENRRFTIWKRISQEATKEEVDNDLRKNVNFDTENILELPASYLDQEVFSRYNNMMTTIYGSVDELEPILSRLKTQLYQ
mgnify:CR=1 FL=1